MTKFGGALEIFLDAWKLYPFPLLVTTASFTLVDLKRTAALEGSINSLCLTTLYGSSLPRNKATSQHVCMAIFRHAVSQWPEHQSFYSIRDSPATWSSLPSLLHTNPVCVLAQSVWLDLNCPRSITEMALHLLVTHYTL